MQDETKETLPEWIERETRAAHQRYLSCDSASSLECMRTVIAPYIEAVDAAQRRSRELEAWLLKTDGETVAERIEREARAAYARYSLDGDHQCAVDAMRAAVAPLVEGNAVLENRVRELEAKVSACADERRELLEDLDKLGSDLAEQRDYSRKLEATIAETRTVERTEYDATWAANELAHLRARFTDALNVDSSRNGEAVALPMAVKPLIDTLLAVHADRTRLRTENVQLARDASSARERESNVMQDLVECEDRLRDCQRELTRQNANVERLASDAGKFSHKWTALLNERDAALAEVASRGVYLTNLEARITDLDREVVKLNANANERKASHGNTVRQLKERAEQFEREASGRRAELVKLNEAMKRRAAQTTSTSAKWLASTDALVDERDAHAATKAELAQTREKFTLCEAEMRRWIGMRDEEARRREAAEMALNAHAETIGVLEVKLEDIRKAYANERAEHASTKSHDAAGALHVAAARAEAIAERERAEEYLATVNGLLRRERERTEVQS